MEIQARTDWQICAKQLTLEEVSHSLRKALAIVEIDMATCLGLKLLNTAIRELTLPTLIPGLPVSLNNLVSPVAFLYRNNVLNLLAF